MRRRWRALVLVALVGASAAACSDDGPGEGEARLEVDGQATVERADGDTETVDGSTDLASGDRVTMLEGAAFMQLRGGTTFELRSRLADAADTQLLMGSPPVLEAGDLLVTTPESTRVEADGTDVTIREGAARLTRAFGMSASAYDADLELDSAGVDTSVPALRQVAVPDLGRPRAPRPVDFVEEDPWDRRYLGAAMDVGRQLQGLADALSGNLGQGEGRTVGYLRLVLPGLEDETALTQEDIDLDRKPGDTLIGAAIADRGERGSFDDRWDDVFGFRDDGAAWGIVALDQSVQSAPLLGDVEQAFDASIEEIAQAPIGDEPAGGVEPGGTNTDGSSEPEGGADGGADGGTDGTSGTGGTDGTDGGSGEPVEPTTPTVPPPLPPPPPDEPTVLDPIIDPVVDLADDLLGGLLG